MNDVSSVRWRKSTRSGAEGGDCVEVAGLPGAVAVRDSKDPEGPVLGLSHSAFRALTRDIHAGRFDL